MDEWTNAQIVDGYAAALLEVAEAEGQRDRVTDELFRIARAFEGSEDLRSTLGDPRVPLERKQAVVGDILESRASGVSIALVNLLVGAGRAGDLKAIANRMSTLSAEREETAFAEVRTAIELDAGTVARLEERLASVTGKKVKARVVVDPGVVGGIVAKVGDTVFDGSVKSRLQDLREAWG
jgi:F-type H+-transporting ATPase subunit delta